MTPGTTGRGAGARRGAIPAGATRAGVIPAGAGAAAGGQQCPRGPRTAGALQARHVRIIPPPTARRARLHAVRAHSVPAPATPHVPAASAPQAAHRSGVPARWESPRRAAVASPRRQAEAAIPADADEPHTHLPRSRLSRTGSGSPLRATTSRARRGAAVAAATAVAEEAAAVAEALADEADNSPHGIFLLNNTHVTTLLI